MSSTLFYLFCHRSVTNKQPIVTVDGKVTDGNINPTMPPATDLEVKPLDQYSKPIPGASVTLECGDPSRSYIGNEQNDGTYIFKDSIPQIGQEDCEMTVEASG